MVEVSERLTRRIRRDFAPGTADEALRALAQLPVEAVGGQDTERVLAAIVVSSHGQWRWFEDAMALLRLDWRDVLVNGGLANEDWPVILEVALSGHD